MQVFDCYKRLYYLVKLFILTIYIDLFSNNFLLLGVFDYNCSVVLFLYVVQREVVDFLNGRQTDQIIFFYLHKCLQTYKYKMIPQGSWNYIAALWPLHINN